MVLYLVIALGVIAYALYRVHLWVQKAPDELTHVKFPLGREFPMVTVDDAPGSRSLYGTSTLFLNLRVRQAAASIREADAAFKKLEDR